MSSLLLRVKILSITEEITGDDHNRLSLREVLSTVRSQQFLHLVIRWMFLLNYQFTWYRR